MFNFNDFKVPMTPEQRRQFNIYYRIRDTGRVHKDKKGKTLCRIYKLLEKETKYSPDKLVELRKERGIGNVRKLNTYGTRKDRAVAS